MKKRKLLEEMPQEKPKETENLRKEVKATPKETKFERKATEDEEPTEEMDSRNIMVGTFPISLKCSPISLTLPYFFKSKEIEESLVEVEKEHLQVEEKHNQRMITIDPSEGSKAQKVILEKPNVEMTRHIRPLYVRAHFNGKPVSKALVDNGSTVNVMSLRMLRALGRSIGDLIETKVSVSASIREISKILGLLLINITVGSKTSFLFFFVINYIANYNVLLGREWIHAN